MAVETKYVIFQNGSYLSSTGDKTIKKFDEYISFTSFEDAETFLEVSGSNGEYQILSITTKS